MSLIEFLFAEESLTSMLTNFLSKLESLFIGRDIDASLIDFVHRFIFLIFFLFLCYLVAYLLVNFVLYNNIKISIDETEVELLYKDIFSFDKNYLKVIAFNEYFDTDLKKSLISEKSLNGQLVMSNARIGTKIKRKLDDKVYDECLVGINSTRKQGNKKRYTLGTCVVVDDYCAVALTHFNDKNNAVLTIEEYVACLMDFWKNLSAVYEQKDIVIPLLGSGITRFGNERVDCEALLYLILLTYRMSGVRLKGSIFIVLSDDKRQKIRLDKFEGLGRSHC